MLVDTFANRLQKALDLKGMKQSELVDKTKLDKSLISNYLSGNYKAKQDNLTILAEVLDVSETWLMGYDVPINGKIDNSDMSELDQILFSKIKKLNDEEKKSIISIMDVIHKGTVEKTNK